MTASVRYNPFTGLLDLVSAPTTNIQATRVVLEFDCAVSAAVGDIVYQDSLNDSAVIVTSDNTSVQPAIGVIITKLTVTRCEVLILGIYTGFSGLTIGRSVFLSSTGGITSTDPTSGYSHKLGVAVAPDTVFFSPTTTRVLKA
jgi:hypothetical protein